MAVFVSEDILESFGIREGKEGQDTGWDMQDEQQRRTEELLNNLGRGRALVTEGFCCSTEIGGEETGFRGGAASEATKGV